MFSGQVIPPGEPLPDLSEDQIVWSNCVNIHKIAKNGTVKYEAKFTRPSKDAFDELVCKCLNEAVDKLPR